MKNIFFIIIIIFLNSCVKNRTLYDINFQYVIDNSDILVNIENKGLPTGTMTYKGKSYNLEHDYDHMSYAEIADGNSIQVTGYGDFGLSNGMIGLSIDDSQNQFKEKDGPGFFLEKLTLSLYLNRETNADGYDVIINSPSKTFKISESDAEWDGEKWVIDLGTYTVTY